jgi:cytochrome P450
MHQGTGPTDHEGAAAGGAARCPYSADGALALHRGGELPWRQLRERHGGLVPVELGPGVPGWLLLGYKENLQVLRDQTYFSADPRPWSPSGAPPARSGALNRDGDEHQRLRLPIVDALASVGTPQLVPAVERAAVHLIGLVESAGSADLIGEYAEPHRRRAALVGAVESIRHGQERERKEHA